MLKIHTEVVTELQSYKGHWPLIAHESKVPLRTLANVASGISKRPRVTTLVKLLEGLARVSQLHEKREALRAREEKGAVA